MNIIQSLLPQVSLEHLRQNLFFLAKDPLSSRTLNFTRPGQSRCTLYEADDFIEEMLAKSGYPVERESVPVQAFRYDAGVAHHFQKPQPEDPWYPAYNLYARKTGAAFPDDLIIVVAHKDSQSWLEQAPGACDNAIGTASVLEIARVLQNYESKRSLWFLFCNEEHWPWTSVTAAEKLSQSEYHVLAVFNQDGPGCKAAHQTTPQNVTRYSTTEGKQIADQQGETNVPEKSQRKAAIGDDLSALSLRCLNADCPHNKAPLPVIDPATGKHNFYQNRTRLHLYFGTLCTACRNKAAYARQKKRAQKALGAPPVCSPTAPPQRDTQALPSAPGPADQAAPAPNGPAPAPKTLTIDFTGHEELFERLHRTAADEMRTPAAQLLYWVKTRCAPCR